MYHEEHALPDFVHARSKDELHIPSISVKGETPVIYFYSQLPQQVSVKVGFPHGIWTQWYPQADFNGPLAVETGSPPETKNGHITWNVNITPAHSETPAPGLPKYRSGIVMELCARRRCRLRASGSIHKDPDRRRSRAIFVLPRPGRGAPAAERWQRAKRIPLHTMPVRPGH